jgi:amino acid transporter
VRRPPPPRGLSGYTPFSAVGRRGIFIVAAGNNPLKSRTHMPLVTVVLTLIVVGVLLWLINTYIPMQSTIKSIINFVVVAAVVLWLLYGFGIISHSGEVHMPVVK